MRALLDTPIRDLLRTVGGGLIVAAVMWMPALVVLLREKP